MCYNHPGVLHYSDLSISVASTKDLEAGNLCRGPSHPARARSSGLSAVFGSLFTISGVFVLLATGFFVTFCGASIRPLQLEAKLFHPQQTVLGAAHQLARRQDCNDTVFESTAAAVTVAAATGSVDTFTSGPLFATTLPSSIPATTMVLPSVASPEGVSVAISTHTAISVIYSFYTTPEASSPTQATSSLGFDGCTCVAATETVSVVVTVVPSTLADATITGNPSTVTDENTDFSFTKGLPDVTVSGNPSTLTQIQTDVSYTTGLPDATVSGLPSTVTNVQTDISLTSGLPDATVSGNPSTVTAIQTDLSLTSGPPDATVTGNPSTVTDIDTSFYGPPYSTVTKTTVVIISDLWAPFSSSFSTATAVTTAHKTITTVYSSLWTVIITAGNPSAPSVSPAISSSNDEFASSEAKGEANTKASSTPSGTTTEVVTKSEGPPVVVTSTVVVPSAPYPSINGTASNYASGTVSYIVPSTTSTVVVSGGSKKPGPRGMGGASGTSNLGCTVMLIAVILFML